MDCLTSLHFPEIPRSAPFREIPGPKIPAPLIEGGHFGGKLPGKLGMNEIPLPGAIFKMPPRQARQQ